MKQYKEFNIVSDLNRDVFIQKLKEEVEKL